MTLVSNLPEERRAFVDARVTRIYGGANEIMKEIVGRSLGLQARAEA